MKKHRKKHSVQITDPQIDEYALNFTSEESKEIKEVVASSDEKLEYIDMLSGNMVGMLLKLLISISGAQRILEVGTFTGYSALMMAEALEGKGEIKTIEMNIRYQQLAEAHFKKYDKHGVIELIKGNALDILPEIEGVFDLIFIDADKLRYEFYFEESMSKLKNGGLIIADNVLWNGTVLEPNDHKAEALHAFNKKIAEDKRVEQVLLPIRDGLMIARKIK